MSFAGGGRGPARDLPHFAGRRPAKCGRSRAGPCRGHSRRLEGFQQATEASFRSVGSRRELFTMRFGGSTIGLRRLVPRPEVGSGEGVEKLQWGWQGTLDFLRKPPFGDPRIAKKGPCGGQKKRAMRCARQKGGEKGRPPRLFLRARGRSCRHFSLFLAFKNTKNSDARTETGTEKSIPSILTALTCTRFP